MTREQALIALAFLVARWLDEAERGHLSAREASALRRIAAEIAQVLA